MITINTHSSIRIAGEKILYFDPYEVVKKPFVGAESFDGAQTFRGVQAADVGARPHDADIIFITHKHYDHFDPESIRLLMNPSTILVAPESIREDVLGAGFEEDWCEFLAPGDEAEIDGVKVHAVPSYNTNKPNHLKEFGWLGYVVEMKDSQADNASAGVTGDCKNAGDGATAGGDGATAGDGANAGGNAQATRYFVAGDTDDNEDIRGVRCDVALVPVGGTYTMDVKEAAAFASIIKPKVAIPTHYGSIVGPSSCGKKFAKALNRLDPEIEVQVLM